MRGGIGGRGCIGGKSSVVFNLQFHGVSPRVHRSKKVAEDANLSQARLAQAYCRATSSSALSVLARCRDCASKDPASSTSDGGRSEPYVGINDSRACSSCLLMMSRGDAVRRVRLLPSLIVGSNRGQWGRNLLQIPFRPEAEGNSNVDLCTCLSLRINDSRQPRGEMINASTRCSYR